MYTVLNSERFIDEYSEELRAVLKAPLDHVALAGLMFKVVRSSYSDVEMTRVWHDQIYLQIHDNPQGLCSVSKSILQQCSGRVCSISLAELQSQCLAELLSVAQMTHWKGRLTKHVSFGHVYTEFVFGRQSAIREGIVPYALSAHHGRLE